MNLGVDFGTTRTVVACADRGNYPIVSFFDAAGDAHDYFPSLVAEQRGALRFGFDAAAAASDPSTTVVRSFKRLLSDPSAVPSAPVRIGGVEIAIDALLEQFLAALRDALVSKSNLVFSSAGPSQGRGLGVKDAAKIRSVVAVPANAFGAQRLVTLDAFRRAGFAPVAMLNEPSAAGFEYTHRHRDTLTSKRDHVVVYDLGGGTFDASLVRMSGALHEVLATAGVNELGGDDFDGVMLDLVLAKAKIAPRDLSERAVGRVLDQCQAAKEGLNPSSRKITIDLEHALEAPCAEAVISVADFYEACAPLVARSIDAMIPVMTRLESASSGALGSRDGGAVPDDVAGIYVVGGASELPIVGRALRDRFGRRVHRSPYASAAIAIGLAIACDDDASARRLALADHYARTFGVFREGAAGREITFDPIFAPGTPLPANDQEPLRIRRDYRAAHNVGHFRFFECSGVGDDGRPRGDMAVSGDVRFPFEPGLAGAGDLEGVPVRRLGGAGDGPRIEEEYALDAHGIVAITIRNLDVGYERVFRVNARA
jgi:molecular chaperone DnaK (HSP70)